MTNKLTIAQLCSTGEGLFGATVQPTVVDADLDTPDLSIIRNFYVRSNITFTIQIPLFNTGPRPIADENDEHKQVRND